MGAMTVTVDREWTSPSTIANTLGLGCQGWDNTHARAAWDSHNTILVCLPFGLRPAFDRLVFCSSIGVRRPLNDRWEYPSKARTSRPYRFLISSTTSSRSWRRGRIGVPFSTRPYSQTHCTPCDKGRLPGHPPGHSVTRSHCPRSFHGAGAFQVGASMNFWPSSVSRGMYWTSSALHSGT